jgi:hypothetical protein
MRAELHKPASLSLATLMMFEGVQSAEAGPQGEDAATFQGGGIDIHHRL